MECEKNSSVVKKRRMRKKPVKIIEPIVKSNTYTVTRHPPDPKKPWVIISFE